MTDSPSHLALRELRIDFTSPKGLVALTGVGLIFGISGPFETFALLPTVPRIAYWLVVVLATYAVGSFINHYLQFRFEDRLGPFPVKVLLLGTVTACGVMVVLTAVNFLFFRHFYDSLSSAFLTFGMVIAISIIVVGVLLLFSPLIDDTDGTPSLLERLPVAKRGSLISISVSDHYVSITTTRGTEMVLMRLTDAIKETRPVSGLQVHRSHWVARHAIAAVDRKGDRALLTLSDGREIPVSRNYIPALRDAGMLKKAANG